MSKTMKKGTFTWKWRYLPLAVVVAYALVVPLIWPTPSADFSRALQAPNGQFIGGTDHYGFDLWTRTALGLRVSLFIGLVSALCATAIGLAVGLIAAVRGGWADRVLMRMTDAVNSIPHLILSVVIVALFRGSIPALVISIAITHWSQVARIVRSTVLAARESEYVAASYGAGADSGWVLRKHLFPVAVGQAVVSIVMLTPHAVWHESALSFLGLGLQPDFPSLGTLMDQASSDIMTGAWWVLVVPGTALLAATLSLVALIPKHLMGGARSEGGADVEIAGEHAAGGSAGERVGLAQSAGRSGSVETSALSLPEDFPSGTYGVQNLSVTISSETSRVDAVVGATLRLEPGKIHGLIGGSGSGKSTLGRALCGQVPAGSTVSGGIVLGGDPTPASEVISAGQGGKSPGGEIALIPQAPASSFTPVRRVGKQIQEIIDASGGKTSASVEELLTRANLGPEIADYFPHQLSGGMAQRAAIAAALATGRPVLVADEPTSALDPDLTASVLELLRSLADAGYAVLLISHDVEDLRASAVCDDLSVMRRGVIVENGPAWQVLSGPRDGYTRALLAALPSGGMTLTAGYERG